MPALKITCLSNFHKKILFSDWSIQIQIVKFRKPISDLFIKLVGLNRKWRITVRCSYAKSKLLYLCQRQLPRQVIFNSYIC